LPTAQPVEKQGSDHKVSQAKAILGTKKKKKVSDINLI